MFTGIIQSLGEIYNFSKYQLEIKTKLDLSDCKIGSSICCDGVCLTVTDITFNDSSYFFKVNLGEETLLRTNYGNNGIFKCKKINLEKSLKIGDEISGHFVYGHIDGITSIDKINKLNNSWEFNFNNFIHKDRNFIVEKASISINGISLTIAKLNKDFFTISIIPHTFENTNLKYLKENDIVNIEFDYLARFTNKIYKNE